MDKILTGILSISTNMIVKKVNKTIFNILILFENKISLLPIPFYIPYLTYIFVNNGEMISSIISLPLGVRCNPSR